MSDVSDGGFGRSAPARKVDCRDKEVRAKRDLNIPKIKRWRSVTYSGFIHAFKIVADLSRST
jgi:hypothetical protein